MIPIVGGMRERPPIQLFQSLSHLLSVLFTIIATFAVWAVEFQEGQQVAFPTSLVHDPPQDLVNRLKTCASNLKWRELVFAEADVFMPHDEGVVSTKLG